eukprot:TRINITY_DN4363_c0_g1_i1.p1 TRINITY_DN4363_c0_g1~~TRINITY_DN4363_c0_g1_i1.p1  ORF type:complete len:371 (-),score=77.73 TRINITY_DN4363_c0_g1_i1:154-1266(-)
MEEKKYILISAPKTREDTHLTLTRKITDEHDLATQHKFSVPDLKVGTLNSLMALSDDLGKIDTHAETVSRKIAQQLCDLNDSSDRGEVLTVGQNNYDSYVHYFTWDESKYSSSLPLKALTALIHGQCNKWEEELKTKVVEYNNVVHALGAEERKAGGNLAIRDISDFVKQESVVQTEYLETVFIVIPKFSVKEFLGTYEKLANYVLPRSAEQLTEDNEYALFRVVLFKKFVADFTAAAREKKWVVKDYTFDPNRSLKAERKKIEAEKDKLKKNMTRWCKTNFAEAFVAWIHLKAIRVFVESVLRYGLPINFQAVLLLPKKGKQQKLRKLLNDMFSHLASKSVFRGDEDEKEGESFFPYVSLEVNLNMSRN